MDSKASAPQMTFHYSNQSGNGGESESEGFLSGEEFETGMDMPIGVKVEEKAIGEEALRSPFEGSSDFSKEIGIRPIARVSADEDYDDDDEDDSVEDAEGGDDMRGKEDEVDGDGNGEFMVLGVEGSAENLSVETRVLGSNEALMLSGPAKNETLEEIVKESGFSDAKAVETVEVSGDGEKRGDSVVGVGFTPERHDEAGLSDLKDEDVLHSQDNELFNGRSRVDGIPSDATDHTNSSIVEADDGIKSTGDGDSVVEAVHVDILGPGVAVVGDENTIKEVPADDISLKDAFVQRAPSHDIDTVDENVFPATNDGSFETARNNQLGQNIDEDVIIITNEYGYEPAENGYGQKSLDTGVQKCGHDGLQADIADISSNVVQDDKKVGTCSDEDRIVSPSDEKNLERHSEQQAGAEKKLQERLVFVTTNELEILACNKDQGDEVQPRETELIEPAYVENALNSRASNTYSEHGNPNTLLNVPETDTEKTDDVHEGHYTTDGDGETILFENSEAAKQFLEELEHQSGAGSHSGAESSRDLSQKIDGQIVTDSDDEVETDEEEGKELFDSAALAALLKAATGGGSEGGSITITSQDGSRLFSVERPAGLGSSLPSVRSAQRLNRSNLFSSNFREGVDSDRNLSAEEKEKLGKLQQIRIKFLRLVQRLGFTPDEPIAAQVLYRMTLAAGRQTGDLFNLDAAKRTASQLEAEKSGDLSFSLNILVLGKTGVGKSATINSIFGESKTSIDAYGPATNTVREIVGMVDGVKISVIDTPGLKLSGMEQSANRNVLSMVKKFMKKSSPDIVLYVDRLDTQTRDLNDLPFLKTIASVLGSSIWRSAIVTLTHAACAPPDGPSGSALSYDVFVAQRSHVVQQTIGQAVGDLRLMNPNLMNPVSLVENHPSCRKNRDGEKVLPNGQSWRPQLLLLCYSMKILSEANNLSKPQDPFDHRKLFGLRVRSPPLPYLLSWLLQSRTHPKLPSDQGGDNGDSDIDLADLSDSDNDDDDEYDQLPPFKPLRKSQLAKLSKDQRKAYLEEYDYRVKLLQKKQWREELRRMKEMKKRRNIGTDDYGYPVEDDQENGSPAAVPVPLPDMVLPPSFDSDNPAYRYRFLEPTSQLLTRPVLDTHGWDHDCGYDGVNIEQTLAITSHFPAAIAVQLTKDKKEFNIHLDSSIAAKHGENGSTMAGFDIQNIGKQLAYIIRGETKFKNFRRNKTAAGVSVTFLGENVSTGLKVEDQIAIGKRLVLVGSSGAVRCQGDAAYGANIEVRLREADFPVGQDQSSLGLSLVKWRGDLALGANFQSQFSFGRSYKMAVRAGLNNKLSGQITLRTSSSDQLQIVLVAILPIAKAIYKNLCPGPNESYSIY